MVRTEQSCRGWRKRRSTGASSTSWGQCTRRRRKHHRYHLERVSGYSGESGACGRTDGGGLDHVADGESLDGLVLGGASGAVGATDGLGVTAAGLVATAVVRDRPSAFCPEPGHALCLPARAFANYSPHTPTNPPPPAAPAALPRLSRSFHLFLAVAGGGVGNSGGLCGRAESRGNEWLGRVFWRGRLYRGGTYLEALFLTILAVVFLGSQRLIISTTATAGRGDSRRKGGEGTVRGGVGGRKFVGRFGWVANEA